MAVQKRRNNGLARKVKQLDWIMAFVVRTTNCAFCDRPLSEGYNPRDPGKTVTLHHTQGSREEDNWDDMEYVRKMLPAHSSCHRSYHLTKVQLMKGANVDLERLHQMEANLQKALNRNNR